MWRVMSSLVVATAAVACVVELGDDGEPRRGGGWDANAGSWNGNMGTWGTVSGIGANPPWAPAGTGPGTLTNPTIVGLRWIAPEPTSPCGALTPGVDRVRFLSSSQVVGGVLGPDVELDRAGARARLTMGERVVFHAQLVDGTMASIRATLEVRRVDTLSHAAAPDADWPVFELRMCEHARPQRGFAHLGFVSWAPMMVLPESEGAGFQFPADLVQPVTTLPRLEYRDNPAVPSVVANQSGSLLFKFAFYATLPVALAGEPELDLRTSRGDTLANAEVLVRGAIALGNGAWVTMPGDNHQFLSFFTRTGTPAAMFAIARGDGGGPAELRLPQAWGGGTIPALQLTRAELLPSAAGSLDAVHAIVPAMQGGDVWARGPSELGHGPSTQRHGYYLGNSGNNRRNEFFAQLLASTARARWSGLVVGRVASQAQLAQLMSLPSPGPSFVVAGEAPPPDGKPAFESPALAPMPPDSPVFAPPPPIDAAMIDGPVDAAVDAPTDAAVDAAMADAPQLDAGLPVDAPTADAPQLDAGLPVDAPTADAPQLDAGLPVDAPTTDAPQLDAGLPIDAPTTDAPQMDAGLPVDAHVDAMGMCKAAGCDAAI